MERVCSFKQLRPNAGVGALVDGKQIAIFYLPATEQKIFALDNWDPIGKAFVMSRGIVGDVKGEPVVASPLYKQHFCLSTGQCIEQPDVSLSTWSVKVEQDEIWISA